MPPISFILEHPSKGCSMEMLRDVCLGNVSLNKVKCVSFSFFFFAISDKVYLIGIYRALHLKLQGTHFSLHEKLSKIVLILS